jgi:hypothetical protein
MSVVVSDHARRLFYLHQQALHSERRKGVCIATATRSVVAIQCQDRNAGALGIYLRMNAQSQSEWDESKLVAHLSTVSPDSKTIRSWSMRHTLHAFHVDDGPLMASILDWNQYAHRARWNPGDEFEAFKVNLSKEIDSKSNLICLFLKKKLLNSFLLSRSESSKFG